MAHKKTSKKKRPNYSEVIVVRCTKEQKKQIMADAKTAGRSLSDFGRRVLTGQTIKAALTEREADILSNMTDVRGDLVNIQNALNGTPDSIKKRLFGNEDFMRRRLLGIENEVKHLDNVLENLTN